MLTSIDDAVAARLSWSRNLSVALEAFYDRPGITDYNRAARHDPQLKHDHGRYEMLGPVGPRCRSLESFGGDAADSYRACGMHTQHAPCTVVSLGSMDKWDFETSIYHHTACHVHTFDCTISNRTLPPAQIRPRVTFHHACVAARDFRSKGPVYNSKGPVSTGKTAVRTFHTWPTLLKSAKITGTGSAAGGSRGPTLLKIDVEGFEWEALIAMVQSSKLLPDQIAMELHYGTSLAELPWYGRFKSAGEIALWMDAMWRHGRYLLVDYRRGACPHCAELLLATETALRQGRLA